MTPGAPPARGPCNQLDAIRAARDQLAIAEKLPCICTGFVIQYEGRCQCAKGKAVGEAKALLDAALAAL